MSSISLRPIGAPKKRSKGPSGMMPILRKRLLRRQIRKRTNATTMTKRAMATTAKARKGTGKLVPDDQRPPPPPPPPPPESLLSDDLGEDDDEEDVVLADADCGATSRLTSGEGYAGSW